eukprot:gene15370-21454_t
MGQKIADLQAAAGLQGGGCVYFCGEDSSATFAVTSASGHAALCPGQTHSLRIATWLTSADNSYSDTVAITCGMIGAVQLLVSWSESKRDSYHQATLTMIVDPTCAAVECIGATPADGLLAAQLGAEVYAWRMAYMAA